MGIEFLYTCQCQLFNHIIIIDPLWTVDELTGRDGYDVICALCFLQMDMLTPDLMRVRFRCCKCHVREAK
jgi:hypothetical protein